MENLEATNSLQKEFRDWKILMAIYHIKNASVPKNLAIYLYIVTH